MRKAWWWFYHHQAILPRLHYTVDFPEHRWLLLRGHNVDCRAVAQDFGDAWGDFCGVVTHANDGICSYLLCVLDHQFIGIDAGLFTELCVNGDVSTKDLREEFNCLNRHWLSTRMPKVFSRWQTLMATFIGMRRTLEQFWSMKTCTFHVHYVPLFARASMRCVWIQPLRR